MKPAIPLEELLGIDEHPATLGSLVDRLELAQPVVFLQEEHLVETALRVEIRILPQESLLGEQPRPGVCDTVPEAQELLFEGLDPLDQRVDHVGAGDLDDLVGACLLAINSAQR